MLADSIPLTDEDEGEAFDFDDSGDDVPEAGRSSPAPPVHRVSSSRDQSQDNMLATHPEGHLLCPDLPAPPSTSNIDPSSANTVDASRFSTAGQAAVAEGIDDPEPDLPPPPPPLLSDYAETHPGRSGLQSRIADVKNILHFRLCLAQIHCSTVLLRNQ